MRRVLQIVVERGLGGGSVPSWLWGQQPPVPQLCPIIVPSRCLHPSRASLGASEGSTKEATRRLSTIRTLGLGSGETVPGAGVALHFGEDNIPTSRTASPAGAVYQSTAPTTPAKGERRIWDPGLGTRRKCGGWRIAGGGERKAARAERPRGGCVALSFKLWESWFRRQRRCDQSESGTGNKLCKSPSGDGSDDSPTLKNLPRREFTA